MKNLYIDFDGVILDTINVTYRMLAERGIDKKNFDECFRFYRDLDWQNIVNTTPEINNSIDGIKKIIDSSKFNVTIFTHVSSENEAAVKEVFMRDRIPNIKVVPVHKTISKAKVEGIIPKGAYLVDDFSGNLRDWEEAGGIGIKFSTGEEPNCPFILTDRLDAIIDLIDEVEGVTENN